MGSPLSPIPSNVNMETYNLRPKVWLSNIDDTSVVWPQWKENLGVFMKYLDNIEESIKFTIKVEEDGKMPFSENLYTQHNSYTRTAQTVLTFWMDNLNRSWVYNIPTVSDSPVVSVFGRQQNECGRFRIIC